MPRKLLKTEIVKLLVDKAIVIKMNSKFNNSVSISIKYSVNIKNHNCDNQPN